MVYEDPAALLRRPNLGREAYFQHLATSLIIDEPYPRAYNTRWTPGRHGLSFLQSLWNLSFDVPWPDGSLVFADEFDLPARSDNERGRGPDWAVLWRDLVWIIELKTERGSHQPDQIPAYFDLGRHHHPACRVWLTYLTPSATYAFDAPGDWARYAHVTWPHLDETIASIWGACPDSTQQACADALREAIGELHLTQPQWKDRHGVPGQTASRWPSTPRQASAVPDVDHAALIAPMDAAIALAELTAKDGRARALDWEADDLDALYQLRASVRERLAATEDESPLRHVMPWLWRLASSGAPMTTAGAATGYELRLSRYSKALY